MLCQNFLWESKTESFGELNQPKKWMLLEYLGQRTNPSYVKNYYLLLIWRKSVQFCAHLSGYVGLLYGSKSPLNVLFVPGKVLTPWFAVIWKVLLLWKFANNSWRCRASLIGLLILSCCWPSKERREFHYLHGTTLFTALYTIQYFHITFFLFFRACFHCCSLILNTFFSLRKWVFTIIPMPSTFALLTVYSV